MTTFSKQTKTTTTLNESLKDRKWFTFGWCTDFILWIVISFSSTIAYYTRRSPPSSISTSISSTPLQSNSIKPAQTQPVAPPPRSINSVSFVKPPVVTGSSLNSSSTSSYYNDAPEFISSRNVGGGAEGVGISNGLSRSQRSNRVSMQM